MHAGTPNLPCFRVRVSLLAEAAFSPCLSNPFIKKHPDLVTEAPEEGFREMFKASFIILENLTVPAGEP